MGSVSTRCWHGPSLRSPARPCLVDPSEVAEIRAEAGTLRARHQNPPQGSCMNPRARFPTREERLEAEVRELRSGAKEAHGED